jgi:signal transduction histidine kinase
LPPGHEAQHLNAARDRPRTVRTLRVIRVAVTSAAVALGFLLLASLAREAQQTLRSLRTVGLDNVQWTATQLETDLLRLIIVTHQAEAAALSDSAVPLDALRDRFDVLYSRVSIIATGSLYSESAREPTVAAGLAMLDGFLDTHVELIDGPDEALRAALPALSNAAEALHPPTRAAVLKVIEHFSRGADAQRAALTALLERAALVTAALLTLLGALVVVLARLSTRQARAQAELCRAHDAARAGERAKASFVAVMSHEMRTPLNGIIASLEILRDEVTAERQAQFLGLAHSSALQLMHQINDVLDISRIEAGRLEVTPAPLDLAPFLDEVAGALGPLAAARGNRLVLERAAGLPARVSGDGFRLRQILQNFLSNAIKFTENGTITLSAAGSGAEDGITFAVADTGRGIRAEDLDRVFEDFVMLDPTYSRAVGGSGLGLSICRRLTAAMGGEIGAESLPGQGSRFWVRLPLPPLDAAPAPAIAQAMPGPAARVADGGLRLLVVDDNAVNRTVVARMLEQEGHAAVLAENGSTAVELARAERFDAILMDISMPGMDGVTAAGLIRAEGASAAVPIFALTAHAMPDELARFRAAGLATSLLKPVRRPALRAALAGLATPETARQATG